MPTKTTQPKTKQIPKLRFPGFSGVCEEKKLGEVATIERGRFSPRPRNNPKYYGGKIPFVQTGDVVKSGGVIKNYTQTINEEGLKVSKLFPKGTILITIAANIGYTGVLDIDMACPDSLIGIQCKDDTDNFFLNYYLSTQQERMDRIASKAAQKNINIEFLKPYKIYWAELPEQQKIADFLGATDTWIENLRTQKENLESYKKGIMQKIFSQEIRFKPEKGKDFPKWEEKKLGEVLDYEQPTEYIVKSTEYDDNYKIPVLTAGKTFILGYTNEETGIFQTDKLPVIIFDDFTTTSQFVDFPFKVKSSAMKILSPKNNTNIKFLYEVMQQIKYEIGGHGRHWISKYSDIKIFLPSVAEQQKIANLLTSIDKVIESKQQQISEANQWKKGLMQGLFV